MHCSALASSVLTLVCALVHAVTIAAPQFEMREIDSSIQVGYGVAVADVDGDRKPDIILVDSKQVAWYRSPSWSKHVLSEHLTMEDNVCVAAADIDDDGKAELAVGAGWNPGDTKESGALFVLEAPTDRTGRWKPRRLPHEPTVHRMRWHQVGTNGFGLAVLPLHGRGNVDGAGTGVRFLSYQKTSNSGGEWVASVINDSWHVTHNFDLVKWTLEPGDEFLVAASEGVFHVSSDGHQWQTRELAGQKTGTPGFRGASEVRGGRKAGGRFVATIEPFHGNEVVIYTPGQSVQQPWNRQVIDSSIREGHALATGDLLGTGSDQLVMGWRAPNAQGKTGIKLYQQDPEGRWSATLIDEGIACEDLCLADLNGDKALDIVASGRATRNLRIYLNKGPGQQARDPQR